MGRIPENLKTYYKTKVVPYAARSKGSLDVIPCRVGYGSKVVKVNGAFLSNYIHRNIRELRNMPELKEGVMEYYIFACVMNWWIITYLYCKMSGCDYVKQLPCFDSELFYHVKALRSSSWRNVWAKTDYLFGCQLDETKSSLVTTNKLQL